MQNRQSGANNKLRLHFVGIGGIGMSALAQWALQTGYSVTGSDNAKNFNTRLLQDAGAKVYMGHDWQNAQNSDIIIYSTAVPPDNPELLYGIKKNLCMLERHKFLGIIFNSYDKNIAVTGSHGKTTCTAMAAQLMLDANISTLCFLGGNAPVLNGGNFRYGNDVCLAEACEYKNNFLSLKPAVAVVLNIESDHTDFFKSRQQLLNSFKEFVGNILPGGTLIICGDDDNCKKLLIENNNFDSYDISIVTYGFGEDNLCRADNLSESLGKYSFDFIYGGQKQCIALSVPGRHSVLNAMAAILAASYAGAGLDGGAISAFKGVCRRFEHVGEYRGASVISDYAHHPREIAATLKSARQAYTDKKIAVVFQPHTYSRTKTLMEEFVQCFNNADYVIILPVYSAREKFDSLGSSLQLYQRMQKNYPNILYAESFLEARDYLDGLDAGAIIIMGAGDVVNMCDYLKEER